MRNLSASFAANLSQPIIRPAFFVSVSFSNEALYLWTGIGVINWNGQTWYGVGKLGGISPISEGSGVEAQGITLTLTGLDPDLMADCLSYMTTSGVAQVFFALFDSSGNMIASPAPAFIGLMDQPVIDYSADTATITLSVENRLSDLNRSRGGRYTDQDQRARHPNDNSLLYVAQLQDKLINWKS